MSSNAHGGREHQIVSLEKRLAELDELSAKATEQLIVASRGERRSRFGEELQHEIGRLRAERKRLEREKELDESAVPEAEADRHLAAIEHQIREVLAERDAWFRHQLDGQRRRRDDFRQFQRLKEENERLTAELMRCAALLARDRDASENPRLRRVWKMLRLSGT